MTARIVALGPRDELRRRRICVKALTEVVRVATEALAGSMPIEEAVHRINRALQPAVKASLREVS